MTRQDTCGNCGASIPKDSGNCPNCSSSRKKSDPAPVFLIVAVVCSSFLMLGSSVVNVATAPVSTTVDAAPAKEEEKAAPVAPKDMTVAAYDAARKFVQEKFPGPKRFSELYQSSVDRNGNDFVVTLLVDELAGSTPVRYFLSVEMTFNGESWVLKEIKR